MKKLTKKNLTNKQLKAIAGGLNMAMPMGVNINSSLFNVNMNIGLLVIAGNKFNAPTTINFFQKIH